MDQTKHGGFQGLWGLCVTVGRCGYFTVTKNTAGNYPPSVDYGTSHHGRKMHRGSTYVPAPVDLDDIRFQQAENTPCSCSRRLRPCVEITGMVRNYRPELAEALIAHARKDR